MKGILLLSSEKCSGNVFGVFFAKCFSSEGGGKQFERHTNSRGENFPFVSDGCRLFSFSLPLYFPVFLHDLQ